jgi:hypothetical protein
MSHKGEESMGPLPITKVVLFKHGVGYFEREGQVDGDAAIDLHFKATEMNDVLKSLTVLDLDGGIVSSISYESTRPIERQLEDFSIRLPDSNSLTGLLSQLKGAQVEIEVGGKRHEGAITGVEAFTHGVGETAVSEHRLALLVDGASLRHVRLLDIKKLTFVDPHLRSDLQHLLDILIAAKKKELKRLTIFSKGEGKRTVRVSYVIETPVWKTSYRVLLDDEASVIQGWALVDNTQDEDWNDVRLSLVAGLPISFVHDLYSPRYKRRPVVEISEEEAYGPPVLEEVELEEEAPVEAPQARAAAAAPARHPRPRPTVRVQTRTAEVGDLFQYEIENPVTVKRNQSALVPIIQGPVEGKRVAVYNPDVRRKNPMSAVLFRNTTMMTLEGGPVTVFQENSYVGEAMLDTLKPGEERLVPFSVELGCVVSTDHRSQIQDVHLARIVHGAMNLYRYRLLTAHYQIRNKLDRPIELFLEHGFQRGYSLVDTPEPIARTESFYRFRVKAPPGKTTSFPVVERGDERQVVSLQNLSREQVSAWVESQYVDTETRKRLEGLIALGDEIADMGGEIERRAAELERIYKDQERLRHNLKALGASEDEQGLRERYVGSLTDGEDRVGELSRELDVLAGRKADKERELADAVKSLEFEASPGGAESSAEGGEA